jgi:hypothetical protein
MLLAGKFIRQSLELHLFFMRIMKEHSFFLQISFTPKDSKLSEEANSYRMEFDKLLEEAIYLSNGVVGNSVLKSGEVFTPYTQKAEEVSSYYTGVKIPRVLTEAEEDLTGSNGFMVNPMLERAVVLLNEKVLRLVADLIQFKTSILSDMLSCKIFTMNYPLLIDHILREAKLYYQMAKRLQDREDIDLEKEAYEQEAFWNRIMAEHSKFIRGLLDPTENDLINKANEFGNEFDKLTQESLEAMNKTIPISIVTEESLKATQDIKEFKQQGTLGLIDCKIKSIIIPLLGDHTLREANHYLRLLKKFKKNQSV